MEPEVNQIGNIFRSAATKHCCYWSPANVNIMTAATSSARSLDAELYVNFAQDVEGSWLIAEWLDT